MVVKIVYLGVRGLAEPARLCLFIGGIDFEDEIVNYEEIQARRGELPFGQVPLLMVDGEVHAQSAAILRWAGKQAQLWPEEWDLRIDAVEAALMDVRFAMRPQWYGCALGRSPSDGSPLVPLSVDQKKEVEELLNAMVLPARFKMLEKFFLVCGGDYFCGDRLTVCDLSWYNMCVGIVEGWYCPGVRPTVLATCPKLVDLAKRVHSHPRVQEWNANHGYPTLWQDYE
ncbi:hypothetical protein CTAYLR_006913 [Chrysophaeum taylorii]|uniref:Glutathione S-transferase n=1 Tax=Chrysophaeum taylorii TaxID=2483200 RepID=A0AAD7XLP7_9STRA|nr:hypothetical protein CTAYLR_006913 [Chrysophaeum taylorii]